MSALTVVKDYVRIARTRSREAFVPLAHPPGHAQVDFGECIGVIGGVRMKLRVFCFDLPQSDACFIKAYPAETTEAFLDGHVARMPAPEIETLVRDGVRFALAGTFRGETGASLAGNSPYVSVFGLRASDTSILPNS
jgi:transposase